MLTTFIEGARTAQRNGSVRAVLLASSVLAASFSGQVAAQSTTVPAGTVATQDSFNLDNSDFLIVEEGAFVINPNDGGATDNVNVGFGLDNINVSVTNSGTIETFGNNNSRSIRGDRNYAGTFDVTIINNTDATLQAGYSTNPNTGLVTVVNGGNNVIRLRDQNGDALGAILIENDGIIRTTSTRADGTAQDFSRAIQIDQFAPGTTFTLNNGENGFIEGWAGIISDISTTIDNAGTIKAIDSGIFSGSTEAIDITAEGGNTVILRSTSLTSGNTVLGSNSIFFDNRATGVNRVEIEAGAEIIGTIFGSSAGVQDVLELTTSDDATEPTSDTLVTAVNFEELIVSSGDWTLTNEFVLPDGASIADAAILTLGTGASITGAVDNAGRFVFGQGDAQTLPAETLITGAGEVAIANGTVLTIDNAQTYAGDTLVEDGTLVLNGSLASDLVVGTGGTVSGNGVTTDFVTVNGVVSPGGPGNAATLTFGGLLLADTATIEYDAGLPDLIVGSDRIQVNGDLTLDGIINVNDIGGFDEGVYRIIDYTGSLTDLGLNIGRLPNTFTTTDAQIQVAIGNQVNLVIMRDNSVQFFDGTDLVADGVIDGGSGVWDNVTTNFTNFSGSNNANWAGGTAVFQNAGGTVTVNGPVTFENIQFTDNGYDIVTGTGSLSLGANSAMIRVDQDVLATISTGIGGTGSVEKNGAGELVLGGTNTFTGPLNVTLGSVNLTGSLAGGATLALGTTLGGDGSVGGVTTVGAGTLAPGDNGVGTFTTGGLVLSANSVLEYELGDPAVVGASDRIQVNGNLTLDGTINVTEVAGFGDGVYRLIDYTGTLTNQGLIIGELPDGVLPNQAAVQVNTPNRVNLLIATAVPDIQFYDGSAVVPNAVEGGSGIWDLTTANWTDADGSLNNVFGQKFAVFSGTAGTVSVEDDISFTGIQFITDGYVIADGGGSLTLIDNPDDATDTDGNTNFRVDPGVTATINADILGTNGLTKLDSGTLVLGGNNTYSGPTNVLGGILQADGSSPLTAVTVADGAMITGEGLVGSLIVNGALSPAGDNVGNLVAANDVTFNDGSTFNVNITPEGRSDTLGAGGDITINGGTVVVTGSDGDYANATLYVLASGDSTIGVFDGVVDNLANIDTFLQYNGEQVQLLALRNNFLFSQLGTTANQIAVGSIFEGLPTTGELTRALLFANQDDAVAALDALSGEGFVTTVDHIAHSATAYRRPFVERMSLVQEEGLTIWGDLGAERLEFNTDPEFAGYDGDRSSYAAGAEMSLGGTSKFGAGVNLVDENFLITGRAGEGDLRSVTAFGYGSFSLGALALRLGGGYSWIDYNTVRQVNFLTFSDPQASEEDGSQVQAYAELAYGFETPIVRFEPFIGAAYSRTEFDGFTENGPLRSALTAGEFSSDQTLGTAGTRFAASISRDMYLDGEVAVDHYFSDDAPTRLLNLGDTPGSFAIRSADREDTIAKLRLGLGFKLGAGDLSFAGIGAQGGDITDYGVRVKMGYSF